MPPATAIAHPIPESLAEIIAGRFRVIGDPTRIRLLDLLRDGPLTINELTTALGGSQQNVSKHVGVLAQAGVVGRGKDGTKVRCHIADESVFEMCELVCGGMHRQLAELSTILGDQASGSTSSSGTPTNGKGGA